MAGENFVPLCSDLLIRSNLIKFSRERLSCNSVDWLSVPVLMKFYTFDYFCFYCCLSVTAQVQSRKLKEDTLFCMSLNVIFIVLTTKPDLCRRWILLQERAELIRVNNFMSFILCMGRSL